LNPKSQMRDGSNELMVEFPCVGLDGISVTESESESVEST